MKRSKSRTELGTAFLVEGNAPKAIQTLKDAVKFNPRNAIAWEKLAIAYASQGAYEESESAFERSLKLEARAETHNNYGLMLVSLKRFDEAIPHFEVASNDITYRNVALSLNNMGQTYFFMERYPDSIRVLSNAIRRAPNMCVARFNRGLAYTKIQQDVKALSDFREVIRLCGDSAFGAHYQAASLLIKLDDIPAACSYLETIRFEAKETPLGYQASAKYKEVCR